jgi:cytochrome c oxidase subunit 2
VQVIGQQWQFTYRFPQYGGVETFRLELPVNRPVEFHVTSLDVVHAFWAYQLGVKADAVPGADNIAFATPRHLGSFDVRCAELCGVWHGEMSDKGLIVAPSAFTSWITSQRRANAPATGNLPPYARSYFPDPPGRAG